MVEFCCKTNRYSFCRNLLCCLGWNILVVKNNLIMESIVKWQTGEPKENGFYLVSTNKGFVCQGYYNTGMNCWGATLNEIAVAWCKLSDIKPYKEEDK